MTCLNPIGSNKRTMSLIASFYPLVTIILEAAIVRHFMNFCKIALSYQKQTVLDQLLLLETLHMRDSYQQYTHVFLHCL